MFKRKTTDALGSGDAVGQSYNKYAGAMKRVEVGPLLQILGPINAKVTFKAGSSLWIYNNAATVGWVALYSASASDPTPSSFANAIACAPNSYTRIAVGLNTAIIGSAATLGAYLVVDDTNAYDEQPAQ